MDRRSWLALWAQDRRRARHARPAPVLSAVYPDKLGWTWNGVNPYRWNIWLSWDNGATWVHPEDYWTSGADHDFWPDGGSSLHLVVGVDAAGYEITARSNPVRPDDALRPPPVLRAEYPGKLVWDWELPDPYRWQIWLSWDNGATWNFNSEYWTTGSDRDFVPDGGSSLHYVVGVDANGNEVTEHSNAVRPDDAPVPPTLLTDLAGYWKLDESAGNDRLDATGNGWDLQEWSFEEAMGNATDTLIPAGTGVLGNAAAFVFGPGQGLVSFLTTDVVDGEFTLAGWVNYNTEDGFDGQGLISFGGLVAIGIRAYTGATDFAIYDADNETYSRVESPEAALTPYEWAHVVYVRDNSRLRIYVNGEEVVNGLFNWSQSGHAVNYFADSNLILGINPWGYPLVGLLDEVGCWARALTPFEVAELYNFGNGLAYENF